MLVYLSSFGSMPSSLLVIGIFRTARLRKIPVRSAGAWFPLVVAMGCFDLKRDTPTYTRMGL